MTNELLEDLLAEAAPAPTRPLDVEGAWRRGRRARIAAWTPLAAVAVLLLAAVTTITFRGEDRSTVVLGEPAATAPGVASAPLTAATAWCPNDDLVAVVTTPGGALEAWCAAGTMPTITADAVYRQPSIGGGRLVVTQVRGDDSPPSLVAFDLRSGAQIDTRAGSAAALSPSGRFAWIEAGPQGGPDVVAVADSVDGQATARFPAAASGQRLDAVEALSWDRGGRWLFVNGAGFGLAALDSHAPSASFQLLQPAGNARVLAAVGERDTPDAAVLLTGGTGEVDIVVALLAEGSTTLPEPSYDILATLDSGQGDAPASLEESRAAFVEAVSLVAYDADSRRWSRGTTISWLVGDGSSGLWLVPAGGQTQLVAHDVADAAVDPAYIEAATTAPAGSSVDQGEEQAPECPAHPCQGWRYVATYDTRTGELHATSWWAERNPPVEIVLQEFEETVDISQHPDLERLLTAEMDQYRYDFERGTLVRR